MGIKNDKFFYLMLLGDGYAVLDESGNPALVGEGTIVEVIKYLQQSGAHREDVQFVEADEDDFGDGKKSEILSKTSSIFPVSSPTPAI